MGYRTAAMNLLSLEALTSSGARSACMERIRRLPHLPEEMRGSSSRRAGVLVALCGHRDGTVSLLYTLRSAHLKSHSGQVSFPGGKYDPDDGTLVETALRETDEELGIPRAAVDVWGEFPQTFPSRHLEMSVTPVVAVIADFDSLTLRPNGAEVEQAFNVPLETMCDRQYFGFNTFKSGYTIPVFMGGPHKIWGLTAMISHIFLSCLLPESVYPMQFQYLGKSKEDTSKL